MKSKFCFLFKKKLIMKIKYHNLLCAMCVVNRRIFNYNDDLENFNLENV